MDSLSLTPHPSFSGRPGPLLVVIADGVGVAPPGASNAVTEADTPTLDALTSGELYTELAAHGPAVGLPSDDDMGNSEVGHNALGAGRIFAQGAKLVNLAIETGAQVGGARRSVSTRRRLFSYQTRGMSTVYRSDVTRPSVTMRSICVEKSTGTSAIGIWARVAASRTTTRARSRSGAAPRSPR